MPCLPRLAVAAATVAFFASNAAAIIVDSDSFEVSDHPTGDRTIVSGGINGISFYTHNATGAQYAVSIVDDSGPGGLGSMALNHSDTTTLSAGNQIIGVLPQPVTLAAQGDFITLNFTFRFTNIATATANNQGFRFGIEGSNGTLVTADNQPTTSDNDQGFYALAGVGATPPTTGSTLFRESGGTAPVLGGLDRTAIGVNTAGPAINNNSAHTASFTITRGSGTNMAFSLSFDGGAAITGSTTTTPYYFFDEIMFSDGFVANPVQFNLDNITVLSNVPEPSSTGLVGIGVAGLLGFVRRRPRAVQVMV